MLIAAKRRLRGVRGIERYRTQGIFGGASVSPGLRGAVLMRAAGRSTVFRSVEKCAPRKGYCFALPEMSVARVLGADVAGRLYNCISLQKVGAIHATPLRRTSPAV